MKKILIFGKNGQVAWELQRSCAILGDVRACGSDEVNLEDSMQVARVIRDYKPDYIVNAAAYTAVDKAESEEPKAIQINGRAVGVMAEESKKNGARFIHYSTDYVFDGHKRTPYVETDIPSPINAYGRSKLLGESLIMESDSASVILRVSWVYGNVSSNFYRTMLRLGQEREELKIVADQIGSPTWSRHIADATAQIISCESFPENPSLYHLSPQGSTSWYNFAKEIFERTRMYRSMMDLKVKSLIPISSAEFVSAAKRPSNSRLCAEKLGNDFEIYLPGWDVSLDLVIRDQK